MALDQVSPHKNLAALTHSTRSKTEATAREAFHISLVDPSRCVFVKGVLTYVALVREDSAEVAEVVLFPAVAADHILSLYRVLFCLCQSAVLVH